jgi:hypothetical protein
MCGGESFKIYIFSIIFILLIIILFGNIFGMTIVITRNYLI